MSYQLGQIPSPHPTLSEVADFMEFQCLVDDSGSSSIVSVETAMGIPGDDDDDPVEDSEHYDCVLSVIYNRLLFSKGHYPFEALNRTIRIKTDVDGIVRDIYIFLLLSTRENMSSGKIADGIDGTALFEKLCAEVLKNYFGENCCSFVFGTGRDKNDTFENKVQAMLDLFNEGKLLYRRPDNEDNQQKDGKLDVVAFIPFVDSRKGQFIAFAQCKTGTSWRDSISQLNPYAFCELYSSPPPGFTPIAVFLVAESFEEKWERLLRNSRGLLFDRLRIMNYLPQQINEELLTDIRKWNNSVIKRYQDPEGMSGED